ncbi:hypothetical protein BN1221_04921 [Brenneria goodwinii]|uniref:Uncharacterized protein n=1 Tax=Brenneria goodwinii TaxID=1109412 RepID=A0A0G4K2Q3_9GAMM|nr:hypothetical protein BN1221_04921 [Brenneria goodwinii]
MAGKRQCEAITRRKRAFTRYGEASQILSGSVQKYTVIAFFFVAAAAYSPAVAS